MGRRAMIVRNKVLNCGRGPLDPVGRSGPAAGRCAPHGRAVGYRRPPRPRRDHGGRPVPVPLVGGRASATRAARTGRVTAGQEVVTSYYLACTFVPLVEIHR